MKIFQKIAMESELEVEKLKEKTLASYSKSEAEVLYDNLKIQKKTQDTDTQEQEDRVDTQPEPDIATEHIRSLTYASEDYSSTFSHNTSSVGRYLLDAAKSISSMGIEYTPKIASKLYKGVIYVFGKLISLLSHSTQTLSKYIERRVNSLDNLKSSIQEYRKALELIEKPNESTLNDVQYSNSKVIDTLKIGDGVNFTNNINTLCEFTKETVAGIDRHIFTDIVSIKRLIAMTESDIVKIPVNFSTVPVIAKTIVKGTVEGYVLSSEHTDSYRCTYTLPSDIVLVSYLPKEGLTDLQDIAKAYSESSIFLGYDKSSYREVKSVDYMTKADLGSFLDSLEKLVDACIAQESLYNRLIQSKKNMKFTLKGYFKSLTMSQEKVSLKNSLVEYIYLKSMFVDKVYLMAAMDIHDYSARVASYALSYVKDNIKQLNRSDS